MELTSEKPKKKRTTHPDRVTLDQESLQRVGVWLEQIDERFKGIVKVSRSDIVNLILSIHTEDLSLKDLKQIKSTHFDDVKFAKWIMSELKRRKASGEEVSYESVVASVKSLLDFPSTPKRRQKKRNDSPSQKSLVEGLKNEIKTGS